MASTINATSTGSGGLITTGNSVNQLELQTGDTTRLVIDSSGNVTIQGQGDLRLADSDSSHYVALQAPGSMAANVTYTLPGTDGTNGQVLQTNGSGTLSFTTIATSTPLSIATTTTVAAAATTTINCALGSVFNITWGASITTLSFTNVPASPQATELRLVFKKDTSANQYSIVWPSSIAWENNTSPDTGVNPNSVIVVTLLTINGGTNWRGSFQIIQGYSAALYGWGKNDSSRLGFNSGGVNVSSPTQIGSQSYWIGIGYQNQGSYALTYDGVINGVGVNQNSAFGALSLTQTTGTEFSLMVPVASGLRAYQFTGTGSFYAIDIYGKLWGWGADSAGQLGMGAQLAYSAPVIIAPGTWIDIANADEVGYAIRSDGTLWATGRGAEGQQGQGNTTQRSVWTQIGSLTTWSSINSTVSNQASAVALQTNGTMWSWGYNLQGQLGLGDVTNRSSPTQIGADTNWVQVSVGGGCCAAIKSNGTLWTWGTNGTGQLGLGDVTGRSSPTQVGALTDWKQVCAASNSMYAIKTNGTLWAWGGGTTGQLGDGTAVSKSSPIQIGSDTDWLLLPKRGSPAVGWIHCLRGTATSP